jgi:hypothetical protein
VDASELEYFCGELYRLNFRKTMKTSIMNYMRKFRQENRNNLQKIEDTLLSKKEFFVTWVC